MRAAFPIPPARDMRLGIGPNRDRAEGARPPHLSGCPRLSRLAREHHRRLALDTAADRTVSSSMVCSGNGS